MPKATAKAPARGRRPKPEIQQEFEAVRQEVAEAREAVDAKRQEAESQREAETRQIASTTPGQG
jgi:hypothetical protein